MARRVKLLELLFSFIARSSFIPLRGVDERCDERQPSFMNSFIGKTGLLPGRWFVHRFSFMTRS